MEKYLALISILLSFTLIFVLIWPKWQDLSILEKDITLTKASLESQEQYFSELENISNQLKEYQENLAKIDSALPKDPLIPDLLNFIQKTSAQSGLSLKGVRLVSSISSQETLLKEHTVEITLSGSYPDLKAFLSPVEKSARLIEIEKISFSLPQKEVGGPIDFKLTIKIYSY